MELHQLRYFVAVADLGSFTRAAEQCHVTQPSLSQQIIKLEKELGQPLLERLGRRVRLTDSGRVLYDRAVDILQSIDQAKRSVCEAGENGQGRLVVGAIPTIAPYVLPPLLQTFRRGCPRAEIGVLENLTAFTVKGCLTGDVDVGLVALPIDEPMLHVEPLLTEELLVSLSPQHRLVRKKRITMDDLSQEPFILLNETHCLGEQIVSFCKQQAHPPSMTCRSAQLLTVQELVALNHGLSLIPQMAADVDKNRRRVYRSLAGTRPARTIAMIWHKQRHQSPLVKRFVEVLREFGREKGGR